MTNCPTSSFLNSPEDSSYFLRSSRLIESQFVHEIAVGRILNPVHLQAWLKALPAAFLPNLVLAVRVQFMHSPQTWTSDWLKEQLRIEIEQRLRDVWRETLQTWMDELELIALVRVEEPITETELVAKSDGTFGNLRLPLEATFHIGVSRLVDGASMLSSAVKVARQAAQQAQAEKRPVIHAEEMDLLDTRLMHARVENVQTTTFESPYASAQMPGPVEAHVRELRALFYGLQRSFHGARLQGSLAGVKRSILSELVGLQNAYRTEGLPVDNEEVSGTLPFESLLRSATWARLVAWVDEHGIPILTKIERLSEQTRPKIIQQALSYINIHLHEDLSLEDIARQCAVSHYYLSHLFRKETGTTVTAHIKKARIDRAMALLKDASLTISEIAYRVGYQDPNYFSKSFRAYVGVSPTEFRDL